ncbi:ABC transporter substrate-binding protein [Numidum massiliense]|uniref:ABC transporter substrate-binding protein n=1 Tax=Numidum massiliense TaxID=1522315 RepID=UPI0006D5B27E|nr:ABC transporter substrate-binding protein [Numidum massiliense]
MKWKSVVAALLSVCLVFVLAVGCSQSSNSDGVQGKKGEGSKKSGEKVTLDFWYGWGGHEGEALEELIKEFNESQDKIVVKGLSQGDYQKQLTAITGGNPPDIATQFGSSVAPWGVKGAMTPLDDLIAKTDTKLDDFVPAALETGKYDGVTYAVPYTMHVNMLFYNKDILKEAGYDEPPETLQELQEYAKKLSVLRKDGSLERLGLWPGVDWLTIMHAYGAEFWDTGNNRVTPGHEGVKKGVAFAKEIWDEYGTANLDRFTASLGKSMSEQNPFFSGRYAMAIGGEWTPTFIEKYAPDLNYGIAPIPYDKDRPDLKNTGNVTTSVLYIPKGVKHPEESWQFLSWLTDKEQMVKFTAAIGNLPTRMSALDDKGYDKVPGFKEFLEYSKGDNMRSFPSLPFTEQYISEIAKQYDAILRGKVSFDEAVKKIEDKMQPLADKHYKK